MQKIKKPQEAAKTVKIHESIRNQSNWKSLWDKKRLGMNIRWNGILKGAGHVLFLDLGAVYTGVCSL